MCAFFFNKANKADRQPKRPADVLARYGCVACPLNAAKIDSPKMGPSLPSICHVLFVGEAPDEDEDQEGKPFVGPSGKLLRECIPRGYESYCGFDNVINCSIDHDPTPHEVSCCSPRRVKVVEQAKPKLIVGIGRFALHWALNSNDLQGLRGRLFVVKIGTHTCHFMATYHPSFVLRTAFNKSKPLTSRFGHCLRMDIQTACHAAQDLDPPEIPTPDEIRSNVTCFNGR